MYLGLDELCEWSKLLVNKKILKIKSIFNIIFFFSWVVQATCLFRQYRVCYYHIWSMHSNRLSAGLPAILSFSQQEPDTARKIYYTIKFSIIIIFEGIISSIPSNLKVFKSLFHFNIIHSLLSFQPRMIKTLLSWGSLTWVNL